MPQPASPGIKSPAGVPPAGTGAAEGQNPDATAGSPPEDDLQFEDDQIVEQDGKKMVPLEALLGEREKWKKRVASATPAAPPPQPAPEPDQPLFNWEKLVPQSGGQQTQPVAQGQPPMDPNQFEDQFRDMVNDKPWQAIMWAVQSGMSYRDRMERQAREVVPDYGNLPVHEISDMEMQALASNPYALRAVIAKAKMAGSRQRPLATPQNPVSTPSQPAPSQEAVKAAMDLIMSMGRSSGVSGEGTRGPSAPPAGDINELDKDSVAYFKSRGYTDEQIKAQAQRIVDIRRRKGQVV